MRIKHARGLAVITAIAAVCYISMTASRLTTKVGAAQGAEILVDQGEPAFISFDDWNSKALQGAQKRELNAGGDPDPLSGSLDLKSVEVLGKTVHVVGRASAHDPRPNTKYIWAIRILSPDDQMTLVLEKLFYDHILTVPENSDLESDFDQILNLPFDSGSYNLDLTWYALPAGTGLDGLDIPSVREFNRAPGVMKRISLDE